MGIQLRVKKLAIYVAVIGLLVFLYILGALRPVESMLTRFLSPTLSSMHGIGISIRLRFDEQVAKQNLFSENEKLRKEILGLNKDEARMKILEEENGILRESLGFLARNEHVYEMAEVISRGEVGDFSGQTETILINKGSQNGVKEGQAVVNEEGVIIGKISETKERISSVHLSNNSSCKIAAAILNDEGTQGITEGELGLTIKMNFIPQNKSINKDDIIVSSGLEELIPRGLVIGRVSEIYKESNELWQWAKIESMINPNSLVFVSVIIQ